MLIFFNVNLLASGGVCVFGFEWKPPCLEGKFGINFSFSKNLNLNLTRCYRQKKWSTADSLFTRYSFCFAFCFLS